MNVAVFNGAGQPDYLYGLVSGINKMPLSQIDILDIDLSEHLFSSFEKVKFHCVFKHHNRNASFLEKSRNIIRFYFLQLIFLIFNKPKIIHFQWLDRYFFMDRIIIPLIAKIRGHKTVLTVHNVNALKRDNKDSFYNRITLQILYRLCNQLIVHTPKSSMELQNDFKIKSSKISIIKHGMNNKVIVRNISRDEARIQLNLNLKEKVILFFGNLDYYKGVDILIDSLKYINGEIGTNIKLIIAGNSKSKQYLQILGKQVESSAFKQKIIANICYIPDEDIEKYFMASDCIVLPYREIYQSGVIFMAYNFGLPILATNVGNFVNDIVQGQTGYIINGMDPTIVAQTIEKYFHSNMYRELPATRQFIKNWAYNNYSWDLIGESTYSLYKSMS